MKKVIYFMVALVCGSFVACKTQKSSYVPPVDIQSLNGSWNIISVNGKKIVSDEPAFLTINIAEKKMYGNNGCNVINGAIITDVTNQTAISFDKVISTMKACMPNNTEGLIMKALNETRSYKVIANGNAGITKVVFCNEKKKDILVLSKKEINILTGEWKVEKLNGEVLSGEYIPTMTMDIAEGRLYGSTSCNRMNGTIKTDASDDKAISFVQVATTRMACPGNNIETPFLQSLEKVTHYKIINTSTIDFLDATGNVLIRLKKQ